MSGLEKFLNPFVPGICRDCVTLYHGIVLLIALLALASLWAWMIFLYFLFRRLK